MSILFLESGHEDLPHPACPDPLTPRHALVSQLGRGVLPQMNLEEAAVRLVSCSI